MQIGWVPDCLAGLAGPDGQGLVPVLPAARAAHLGGVRAGVDGGGDPSWTIVVQVGVALEKNGGKIRFKSMFCLC